MTVQYKKIIQHKLFKKNNVLVFLFLIDAAMLLNCIFTSRRFYFFETIIQQYIPLTTP